MINGFLDLERIIFKRCYLGGAGADVDHKNLFERYHRCSPSNVLLMLVVWVGPLQCQVVTFRGGCFIVVAIRSEENWGL
jgi:hypothetical protein